MPDIQFIRPLREREGWSLRRIAREFHFSRKTVTKYLQRTETTETPQYVRRNPSPAPQMDPPRAVIASWLRQDAEMPRKQRHTSRRIGQRLREEYGATAAESTVRHSVARMRRELQPAAQPVFLDLVFDPAEAAQVDWGEVQVIQDGQSVTAQMFCMRLAYSGACYVQLFPHQRLETFLAAHVAAFEFFGFVPQRIIDDNLTTVVQHVLHGRERELNPRFQELTAHYIYDAVFVTPAAGWEKGLVEGLVGYVRRTDCVPLPSGPDWDTLNAALKTDCLAERVRTLPRRHHTTIGELWDHERTTGASRPVTWWPVRATSQAMVRHRRVPYSVPASRVGQTLRLAAYWDHVEIWIRRRVSPPIPSASLANRNDNGIITSMSCV
ncbi:Integrase catalytic region [Sulfobacillus acidophilus DSM 10332]|uniref:Integrase catalytic region n=1 Tax=Sulfobacillus acidophilus (strain ATCC 700253 / DSM 10332 / NAL) TaxID=679936 RepID=G8TZK2_SULAD|nr:Integrase catalytic region [Sulfobacillus acidophilus DSM 10332]